MVFFWTLLLTHFLFSFALILKYRLEAGFAQFYALAIWLISIYFLTLPFKFDFALILVLILTCTFICYVCFFESNGFKSRAKQIFTDLIPWALFVLFLLISIKSSFRFTTWDEFASWGANLKVFLLEGDFGTSLSSNSYMENGLFISYPPIPLLSEAIFSFGGAFKENRAIFGLDLLVLSTMYAICSIAFPKKKVYSFFITLFMINAFFLTGFNLNSLMVDGLLGAVFLLGIVVSSRQNTATNKERHLLFFILLMLPLLKPVGLLLVVPVLIQLITTKVLYTDKKNSTRALLKEFSIYTAVPFVSYISWQIHLHLAQVSRSANNFDSFQNLFSEARIIIKAYIEHMSTPIINLPSIIQELLVLSDAEKVSSFTLFTTLLLLLLLFTLKSSGWIRALIGSLLVWGLGFIIFETGLLFSYLFFFIKYESNTVAGLDRFNGTFYFAFLGYLILTIFTRIYYFTKYKLIFTISYILIFFVSAPQSLINSIGHINNVSIPSTSDDPSNRDNAILRQQVESLVVKLPKDSNNKKSYFIAQDSTGLANYMFDYLILPRQSNYKCWSIGKKYRQSDFWTCPGDLATYLPEFDYLVLYFADFEFWNLNSRYLDSGSFPISRGIYEIRWQNGDFKLVNR